MGATHEHLLWAFIVITYRQCEYWSALCNYTNAYTCHKWVECVKNYFF